MKKQLCGLVDSVSPKKKNPYVSKYYVQQEDGKILADVFIFRYEIL